MGTNFLIGVVVLAFGLIWAFHPEPWLLDKPPNEALLQTTFKNLFIHEINKFCHLINSHL